MEIVRLSELPEEERRKFDEHFKAGGFPPPRADFDEYNLRYDIEHLNDIGGGVSMLPLEYAAEYVDGVTKGRVDAGEPLQELPPLTPETFKGINATGVGNLAYGILHSKKTDGVMLVKHMEFYNAYQNWYLDGLGDLIKNMAKK